MPEFFPAHNSVDPEFLAGYMGAFEWLWPEDGEDAIDRDKVRGWSADAKRKMRADCKAFVNANAADLALYCELSQRDMESAGHDFYLSREGHGAGFFDRGNHPVFDRLQKAARVWGEAGYPWLSRGWVRI